MPKRRNKNAPYWTMLRQAERQIIEYALQQGGTITKTASLLGINTGYLSQRVRALGVFAPTAIAAERQARALKRPSSTPVPRTEAENELDDELDELELRKELEAELQDEDLDEDEGESEGEGEGEDEGDDEGEGLDEDEGADEDEDADGNEAGA